MQDDAVFLGKGRISLLKAIADFSSLNKAAKSMDMSYNKAIKLIHEINGLAEKQVVISNTGGKGGGGTQLTPYGKKLIEAYETINTNCNTFLKEELKKLKKL